MSKRKLSEDELSNEDRKTIALEAVKYLVAYGFHPDLAEQCISDLAAELIELNVGQKEILATIQEVKQSDESIIKRMFSRMDNNPFCPDCPEGRIVHFKVSKRRQRRLKKNQAR